MVNNASAPFTYIDMGNFSFTTHLNETLLFSIQLADDLVGQDHFYVKARGYCMRGNIPSSLLTPPDKSLTWVTSTGS